MTVLPTDAIAADVRDPAGDDPAAGETAPAASARRWKAPSGLVCIALGWLVLVALAAIVAPLLPLRDPDAVGGALNLAPGLRWPEPLGTDNLGRSELSRIVFGARVTITVGLGAALAAMAVGMTLGMIAGYFRGVVETLIDVVTSAMQAFPPLIFLLALASVLRPNLWTLTLSLAVLVVPQFVRVSRANTLTVVNREFVTASRALGASHARVIFRDVLPLVALPVLTFSLLVTATLVVAEGSLSFLGLGVRPPQSSWGNMVAAGQPSLSRTPHLVFVPSAFFLVTVASLNLVGDWARARVGRQVEL